MGKETELLKAVKNNDDRKVQKLLKPEKDFQIQKADNPISGGIPGGRLRMRVVHIDVNCKEENTGYTPLILAVLNGNRDIAETLVFYCAGVNTKDSKGNTPLHMATFAGRLDIIHLLMKQGTEVDAQNSDGNTALHIICQSDVENRVMIISTLLRAAGSVYLKNKKGEIPLDIAAMYNKMDAVSALMDHDPSLVGNTSALVEASLRGHTEIVRLLLDFGINPNVPDDLRKTCALHEATRFSRYDTAEILLKFGAYSTLHNVAEESPESIMHHFWGPKLEKFKALFKEYSSKGQTETPRFATEGGPASPNPVLKDYPELPTDPTWTQNSLEYCNECTANNPNTNILDGNLNTFWVIPAVTQAWMVLDLHHEHLLSGITIYGWASSQMVKCFELQTGESLQGPWSTAGMFYTEQKGSDNPKDNGVPQTFKNITAQSRYFRFNVISNHGGQCTCFQGLSLYGVDCRLIDFFQKIKLPQYTDVIIDAGYNVFKKFLLMTTDELKKYVNDTDHLKLLLEEIERQRIKEFPLTSLKWVKPPPLSAIEGKIIPDFSVIGDIGCSSEVEVICDSAFFEGTSCVQLTSENPSICPVATFSGLSIKMPGTYEVTVRGVKNPDVNLKATSKLVIKPKNMLTAAMERSFDEMETMLQQLQDSF